MMLSTIQIDVDSDNQPIIVINYQDSTDIRDKLVKKFLETFNGSSLTHFGFNDCRPNGSISSLRPIPFKGYPANLVRPIEEAEIEYQRQSQQNKTVTGNSGFGEYIENLYEGIAKLTQPQKTKD